MARLKTREEWLEAATKALRPKFKAIGVELPKIVRVSCGWPSQGGMRPSGYVDGQCWPADASEGARPEIFINPRASDPIQVAAILVHELVHAAGKHGHGAEFRHAAVPLGLVGKMTATLPGKALKDELATLVKKLGPYPHSKIKPSYRLTKKQTTRLLKVLCSECGYTVRVTAKWVEVGFPTCPCGGAMAAA